MEVSFTQVLKPNNNIDVFNPTDSSASKRAPGDNSRTKDRLDYWQWLARLAEKGKVTSIFVADGYATLNVYGGNSDAAYNGGTNAGALDPLVIVPAMASVTKSVSFGITASTSYIGTYGWCAQSDL